MKTTSMNLMKVTLAVTLTVLVSCSGLVNNQDEGSDLLGNGGRDGNSGDALICAQPHPWLHGRTAMLLDFYEAERVMGLTIKLDGDEDAELGVVGKLDLLMARVEQFDPELHRALGVFYREVIQDGQLSQFPPSLLLYRML